MALFIKKSNGGIFNATLVQNIVLDDTTVIIRYKNGEEFKEEYTDSSIAETRYTSLVELILTIGAGSSGEVETLKEIIEVQAEEISTLENTVSTLTEEITTLNTTVNTLTVEINDAEALATSINGEEV